MLLISTPPPLIVMVCPMNTAVTWWWDYFSKNKHYILLACRQSKTVNNVVWQSDRVKATPSDNNFISNSIQKRASSFVHVNRIVWVTKSRSSIRRGVWGNKNHIQNFIGIASTTIAFTRRRSGRVQRTYSFPCARHKSTRGRGGEEVQLQLGTR